MRPRRDVLVYAIVSDKTAIETFVCREDAEFIEAVRRGDAELAARLRLEPVELHETS